METLIAVFAQAPWKTCFFLLLPKSNTFVSPDERLGR
jgi:hypothetical protein